MWRWIWSCLVRHAMIAFVCGTLCGACDPPRDRADHGSTAAGLTSFVSSTGEAGSTCSSAAAHLATCQTNHGFPAPDPAPDLTNVGNCPNTGCGLNGVWLGNGVPFRTLHLSPVRGNKMSLFINSVVDQFGESQDLDVRGDTLYGKGTDTALQKGTKLYLAPNYPATGIAYILTITDVTLIPFWAQPGGVVERFPVYKFVALNEMDGCPVEMCKPGISNETDFPNLEGYAVIFKGDLYDDNTHTVRDSPSDPADYESDTFNIACLGTDISKLHLLRHTNASQTPGISPPTPSQRQALLRLLTADYCGNGTPFTINGIPINLNYNYPPYTVTSGSKYPPGPSDSIDAAWSGDGGGAVCIGSPRLDHEGAKEPDLLNQIINVCNKSVPPHQLAVPCPSALSVSNPFGLGNYAISTNPGP